MFGVCFCVSCRLIWVGVRYISWLVVLMFRLLVFFLWNFFSFFLLL